MGGKGAEFQDPYKGLNQKGLLYGSNNRPPMTGNPSMAGRGKGSGSSVPYQNLSPMPMTPPNPTAGRGKGFPAGGGIQDHMEMPNTQMPSPGAPMANPNPLTRSMPVKSGSFGMNTKNKFRNFR